MISFRVLIFALLLLNYYRASGQWCYNDNFIRDSTYYFYVLNEMDTVFGNILSKEIMDGEFVQFKTDRSKRERTKRLKHPKPIPYEKWEYFDCTSRLLSGAFKNGREAGIWSFSPRHGTAYGLKTTFSGYFYLEFKEDTVIYSGSHGGIEVKFINDSTEVTGNLIYHYNRTDENEIRIDCNGKSGCAYFIKGYSRSFLRSGFEELENNIADILFGRYHRQIRAVTDLE